MCGRFTLTTAGEELAMHFDLEETPVLQPRYNIAPSQLVAVVRRRPEAGRRIDMLRWGFVPRWTRDPVRRKALINARAETLMQKPSFRDAFCMHRCLVPADGFYEWSTTNKRRQPFLFRMRDGGPFAIAGLWEPAPDGDGDARETCALVTTEANALLVKIHDRMPAILPPEGYGLWLDPDPLDLRALIGLLRPFPDERMDARAVSPRVNDPRSDDPDVLAPAPS